MLEHIKKLFVRLVALVVIGLLIFICYCLVNFQITLFSVVSLALGTACLLLTFVIFAYAKTRAHYVWSIFNLCLSFWGLTTYFIGTTTDFSKSLVLWKLAHIAILLVPVIFCQMIYTFCDLKGRAFLRFAYFQAAIVIALNITTKLLFDDLHYVFNSFYYYYPTKIYFFFFIFWVIIVIKSFYELARFIFNVDGLKRTQSLYLFWGMLLGFVGGTTTVAPAFGYSIYPIGHSFICIYDIHYNVSFE